MNMIRRLFIVSLLLTTAACATRETTVTGLNLMSEREYEKVLERFTHHEQQYKGLYNTMDVTATLIVPSVAHAELEQKARIYQWDRAKFQAESNKLNDELRTQTQVFMSFYTPEHKNDDLQKLGTQWRVYLEAGGRRWEGKVAKIKTPTAEIQGIYPYHVRFSTPYLVTFPTAANTVAKESARFIVTGPVGLMALDYSTDAAPGLERASSDVPESEQVPPGK